MKKINSSIDEVVISGDVSDEFSNQYIDDKTMHVFEEEEVMS